MGFIPVLLFIAFAAFIIKAGVDRAKKMRSAWRAFGESVGLTFTGETISERPRLHGFYKGVAVDITTEVHGSGKSRHTYTRYRGIIQTPLPSGLTVWPENMGTAIAKFFGGQDIQVGVGLVDDALRIRGTDETATREFLSDSEIQQAMLAFIGHDGGRLESGDATFLDRGETMDATALARRLDSLVDFVRRVEAASGLEHPPAPQTAEPAPQTAEAAPTAPPAEPIEQASPAPETPVEPEPSPEPEPATPEPPPAPEPAAPVSNADPAVGARVAGTCTVDRVTWTTNVRVSAGVAGGQSVVGTLHDGLKVEAAFPRERDDEVKRLHRGDTIDVSGTIVDYDTFDERWVVETGEA